MVAPDAGIWRAGLREALAAPSRNEARERLRRVPKTDLHAHCLLSMPIEAFDAFGDSPVSRPPEKFSSFAEFDGYIRGVLVPRMRGAERIRALTRATLERMADEGVVYAEVSIDLMVPRFLGISMTEYGAMLSEEKGRVADRLVVSWDAGMNRELPVEQLAAMLDEALPVGFLGAIDLYGDEQRGDLAALSRLYARARDFGLKLKAHAGELRGADSVREAVEVLGVTAVQHGVTAVDDPALLDLVGERGVVLNVCPTSNQKLGIVPRIEDHPVRRFLAHGLRVTVNSDDYAVFGADVTHELLRMRDDLALPFEAIEALIEHGLSEAPADVQRRVPG